MFNEISTTHKQSLFVEHAMAPRSTLQRNAATSYGLPVGPSSAPRDLRARIPLGNNQQSSAQGFKMMTAATALRPTFNKTERYEFREIGIGADL